MEEFLKKFNLRVTKQRVLIVQILSNKKKPVSYSDIKQQLFMDKATFYRNIEKLESAGAITKLELSDGWYFELYDQKHSHFICKTCHQIECLSHYPDLKDYEVETALFKGVCKECS